MSLGFLLPQNVKAEDYCNCYDTGYKSLGCISKTSCASQKGDCYPNSTATCTPAYGSQASLDQSSSNSSNKSVSTKPGYLGGSGIAQYIPDCTQITGQCSDVSVFLITIIGIGQYVFGIIGVLALVMFVYGGLVWITANGNPEKVKQGMGIFMSAMIGLVIVFSAYMLVKYFGSSILNIGSEYQLQ